MQCPRCDSDDVDFLGVRPTDDGSRPEEVYRCGICGVIFTDVQARVKVRVDQLFAERFPPGSGGPPAAFNIGSLYEQAYVDVMSGES